MRHLLFVLSMGCSLCLCGQANQTAVTYGNNISATELKEYLSIIASDALEGRKTGTRGQKMAGAFISNHFKEIGLTPPVNGSYYQSFDLYSSTPLKIYVKAGTTQFDNQSEVLYIGNTDSNGEINADLVFVGKGTDADYAQVDVKGKAALLLVDNLNSLRALRSATQSARDKGASMIFVVAETSDEDYKKSVEEIKEYVSGGLSLKKPEASPNKGTFIISHTAAEKLFNTAFNQLVKSASIEASKKPLKKWKPAKIAYAVSIYTKAVQVENVLGFLEGTEKKDEVVLVTAHYDHIGTSSTGEDKINNGADDDGSGTVAVLELAKVFAQAKKEGHGPKRSMVFMTVTGEEMGLLGSEYYVEHPVYPLANTVVDLNIDMIGRTDPQHKDKPDYVYVIGSDKLSSELHALSEKTNDTYTKLTFDYTYNAEDHPDNIYRRSDHWNFAKNGIPIIFYFDGIHEDYHMPSDEVSKIDFPLLAKRTQNVFFIAWEIANRENRLVVDKK
jgi:hypothetical protein